MADYFSTQAGTYAKARPHYPAALIDYITELCNEKHLAWDCATGNGQTAHALASYFEKIIATDLSPQQLSNAFPADNISYRAELAEKSSLQNSSADLITVATAIHWFSIPDFFKEAERVLKPQGILAVWSYSDCDISPEVNKIYQHYAYTLMWDYWPKEAMLLWKDKYETISFPFELLTTPDFTLVADYTLEEFENYLLSWSSTQRYIKQHGNSPLDLIHKNLRTAWGDPGQKKSLKWSIILKCGRKK